MMRATRLLQIAMFAATLVAWAGSVSLSAPPGPIDKLAEDPEAERRIKAGLAFLKSDRKSWQIVNGRDSLVALALAKCGIPETDPYVRATVQSVLTLFTSSGEYAPAREGTWNYIAGVNAMLLGAVDGEKYRTHIHAIGRFLLSTQNANGSWDYSHGEQGDTSISQYAILGLWEAARHGLEVPETAWSRAARWHIATQSADGGFVYHPHESGGQSTYTMTVAGTGSLLVCRRHLYPTDRDEAAMDVATTTRKKKSRKFGVLERGEEIDKPPPPPEAVDAPDAIVSLAALKGSYERGHGWLRSKFTARPETPWTLYYLYGIERLAALYGPGFLGGRDWYGEGLAVIAQAQAADGSINDHSSTPCATSFAVLFLVRATAKIVAPIKKVPTFGTGLLVGGRGLPDNLADARLKGGTVESRKAKTPVEELLAQLENPTALEVDAQQDQLVEQISTDEIRALVGQTDRLLKLARDKRDEVRRTALWALGRADDLRVVPVLIDALRDSDPGCVVEARNALQFLSRRPVDEPPGDEPTEEQKLAAVKSWKKWYLTVRPYAERDDLEEPR